MDNEIINEFYNEKLGNFDKVKEEFEKFTNNTSVKNNILIRLYNKKLCSEDFEEYNLNTIRKNLTRLYKDNFIDIEEIEDKTKYYTLNTIGLNYLLNVINKELLSKNTYILNSLRIDRKEKTKEMKISALIEDTIIYFDEKLNIQDFLINGFFTFDLIDILEINIELGEYIIENFENAKNLFKECIKDNIPEYSKIEIHMENIKFINLHKVSTQKYKLSNIPKKSEEFINIQGLLIKKDPRIKEEVIMNYYNCLNPNCSHYEDKLKVTKKINDCPQCKSKLNLIDEKIKAVQYLEIKDPNDDTSIKVKAYDNLINELSDIKVGEELSLNGNMVYVKNDNIKNDNETKDRIFILNNFRSSANSINLSEEDIKEVESQLEIIKKDKLTPYDFLIEPIKEMYPLHPNELLKFILIPQILNYRNGVEDIFHILSIGSPNTYKTSLLKAIGEISPKVKPIDFSMLSVDKFYGGVKADGLTDVGLAMSLRDGSLIIDEIDKDKDSFVKSATMLNEVMTEQTATKERVGASIFLKDVNMRIYGVMNDKEDMEDLKWIMKNINESTITRFFIIDFDYFINEDIRNSISKQMITSTKRILDDYDTDIRKKIIVYLRNFNVDITEIHEDLFEFIKQIRKVANGKEHLTRNVQQIKNIIIGVCRLKNKPKASKEDLLEAINLMGWTFKTQGLTIDKYNEKFINTLEEIEIDRLNLE